MASSFQSPLGTAGAFFSAPAEGELEPAMKRRREQLAYLGSEEFQKVLKAKSKHTGILREVRPPKSRDG